MPGHRADRHCPEIPSPSPFLESRGLDELRGRAPYRRNIFVDIHLHCHDQSIEVDAERNSCLIETSDCGNFTLIECTKYLIISHHVPLLPIVLECPWLICKFRAGPRAGEK